jgi:hypothetical protein
MLTRSLRICQTCDSSWRLDVRESGDAVALRGLVQRHGALVFELKKWLLNELQIANDPALEEANELVVQANTIFVGRDREVAERISKRFEEDQRIEIAVGASTMPHPTNRTCSICVLVRSVSRARETLDALAL